MTRLFVRPKPKSWVRQGLWLLFSYVIVISVLFGLYLAFLHAH